LQKDGKIDAIQAALPSLFLATPLRGVTVFPALCVISTQTVLFENGNKQYLPHVRKYANLVA
jgi:hypothetical protein